MKKATAVILDTLYQRYPLLTVCQTDIQSAFALLYKAFQSGHKLLVCGNGGSAADSGHIASELMKAFKLPRPLPEKHRAALWAAFPREGDGLAEGLQQGLPVIDLTANGPLMTAYANDADASMVFAQQVYGYGRPGDALLGISTSGSAVNVIRAVQTARAFGLAALGLTGQSGGVLAGLCDVCVRVPAAETYIVQELHLPVYHALCAALESEFFGFEG